MQARGILIKIQRTRAFSLIEIALSLAIISFALVGILGLFPVAIDAATDSQRETQAALIARSIFADLKSQNGSKRHLLLGTNKNLLSSGADPRGTITINLAENSSHYLAYDNINAESLADSSDDAGSYVKGRPDAAYMVKITTSNTGAPTDLTQLQVIVSSPGAARESARQSYAFVSLLPTK